MSRLTKAGWSHVCTVMSDKADNATDYGMLYIKVEGTECLKFWLNKDTFQNLPS